MATSKTAPKKSAPRKAAAPKKRSVTFDAKTRRSLLIFGGIVAGILALVLLGQLTKRPDLIAAHMPADAAVYIHVDLKEVNSAEMQKIVAAFQTASGQEDTEVSSNAIQQELANTLDVSYEEDIKPWLGDQMGFALFDVGSDGFSGLGLTQYLGAIESKNDAAADAFVAKVAANAESNGDTVTTVDYQGSQIYVMEGFVETRAITRVGSLVFIADSADSIQTLAALNASDSLASLEAYKRSVGALPGGRMFTAYMGVGQYMTLLQSMSGMATSVTMPATSTAMLNSTSVAMGVAVVSEGIQIDVVGAFDEANMPAGTMDMYAASPQPLTTIERYPEDTVMFLGANSTGNAVSLEDAMGPEAFADFEESMQLLEGETGLDLISFIEALNGGETSMGIFPQSTGVGQAIGLGFQMLVTTQDDAALGSFISSLNNWLGEQMGTATEQRTLAGMNSYVVADPSMGDVLAFGSGNGLGFLTTDTGLLEASLDSGFKSLADSDAYRSTWRSFPAGSIPVFYLDMTGLVDAVSSSMMAAFGGADVQNAFAVLAPLTKIAGASEPYRAGVSHSVFIIFIER